MARKQPKLTRDRLKQVFDYSAHTGEFAWRTRTNPRAVIGGLAGSVDGKGYRRIMVDREIFHGHRLAWFWTYNEWPEQQIVHKNGNPLDNRITNLRLLQRAGRDVPLSREKALECLTYDPETGSLVWRIKNSNRSPAGSAAGTENGAGYRVVRLMGRTYLAHRLIWFMVHGEWPSHQIDHKNGVKSDNRLTNLRPATNAQNAKNTGPRRTNTSGFKGVSFDKRKHQWVARIICDYRIHMLGYFETKERANDAYQCAAKRLHGEFARA